MGRVAPLCNKEKMTTKYFHELTKDEFDQLRDSGMTWGECAAQYPQPEWCQYPRAVNAEMGCWSLMYHTVTGEGFCKSCDLYKAKGEME